MPLSPRVPSLATCPFHPTRVLVAGGGVAGLETVLALQALAGDRLEIELLAPGRNFIYRPLAVAEPFRSGSVRRIPLAAIAHDRGVRLHRDALARVLPDELAVETQGGARLGYDALVLALGARPVEAIRGALTFRGSQDAGRVAEIVGHLREGTLRRVAFVVPERHDLDAAALRAGAPDRGRPARVRRAGRAHGRHSRARPARRVRQGGERHRGRPAGGTRRPAAHRRAGRRVRRRPVVRSGPAARSRPTA